MKHLGAGPKSARTGLSRDAAPLSQPTISRGLWLGGALVLCVLSAWASLHRLFPGEVAFARWLQSSQIPGLRWYEEFADFIGMRETLYFMCGLGLIGAVVLRKWSLAALVIIAPSITWLGHLFKIVIQRPRPSLEDGVAVREVVAGYSFPSGHSLQAAIICVVVLISAQQMLPGRLRLPVQAVALWLATTIGWERVFDGVHWPTDVVGGLLLGLLGTFAAWFGIKWVVLRATA